MFGIAGLGQLLAHVDPLQDRVGARVDDLEVALALGRVEDGLVGRGVDQADAGVVDPLAVLGVGVLVRGVARGELPDLGAGAGVEDVDDVPGRRRDGDPACRRARSPCGPSAGRRRRSARRSGRWRCRARSRRAGSGARRSAAARRWWSTCRPRTGRCPRRSAGGSRGSSRAARGRVWISAIRSSMSGMMLRRAMCLSRGPRRLVERASAMGLRGRAPGRKRITSAVPSQLLPTKMT